MTQSFFDLLLSVILNSYPKINSFVNNKCNFHRSVIYQINKFNLLQFGKIFYSSTSQLSLFIIHVLLGQVDENIFYMCWSCWTNVRYHFSAAVVDTYIQIPKNRVISKSQSRVIFNTFYSNLKFLYNCLNFVLNSKNIGTFLVNSGSVNLSNIHNRGPLRVCGPHLLGTTG